MPWWQLKDILDYKRQEAEYWANATPMACPLCGEAPLRQSPPSEWGASVELYCPFDGWQYPRDYIRPEVM